MRGKSTFHELIILWNAGLKQTKYFLVSWTSGCLKEANVFLDLQEEGRVSSQGGFQNLPCVSDVMSCQRE